MDIRNRGFWIQRNAWIDYGEPVAIKTLRLYIQSLRPRTQASQLSLKYLKSLCIESYFLGVAFYQIRACLIDDLPSILSCMELHFDGELIDNIMHNLIYSSAPITENDRIFQAEIESNPCIRQR